MPKGYQHERHAPAAGSADASHLSDSARYLAGRVAHDLNNILGVISGYIQLIQENPGNSRQVSAHAEHAAAVIEQAVNVTSHLQALSRHNSEPDDASHPRLGPHGTHTGRGGERLGVR